MHYVKHFDIDGVATRQAACIELHGKPNAATEGALGVLGIDVDSPTHDVYKCVAVNGSIYTWELLSSGLSILSATVSRAGSNSAQFPYANLLAPAMYLVKKGDLILDTDGYLYQIDEINTTYCVAKYAGSQFNSRVANGVHIGANAPTKGELLWLDTDDYPDEPGGEGNVVDSPIVDVIARAGQVIAVKAVDEEGKPLEYHGVDLPNVPDLPEPEQPDWNAAEGEAGHVLNRTHYVDEKGVVHKLSNKFIDAEWMATKYENGGTPVFYADLVFAENTSTAYLSEYGGGFKVDPGFVFDVYWGGVKYVCPLKEKDDEPYIGNAKLGLGGEDTGEPFCLFGSFFAPDIIAYVKKDTATAETIEVNVVIHVETIYNKLPEEFLPDGVTLFCVNISAVDGYSCSTPVSTLETFLDTDRRVVAKITTDTGVLFAQLCSYETNADNSYGHIVMFALGALTFTLTPTSSGSYEVTVSGD